MSNQRIFSIDDETVSFRWRSYADEGKTKVMTLGHTEFIRRFLLHVLPRGFQRIRYYGFMANCKRKKALARCREILEAGTAALEKKPRQKTGEKSDLVGLLREVFRIDLTLCPKCHHRTMRPVFAWVRYSGGVF